MAVQNADVARMFEELADLLSIQGASEFRVRAYRNAARNLRDMSRSVAQMVADGKDLSDLEGIGDDLAGKIETLLRTGKMPALEKERKRLPKGVVDLLRIEGLGPKRVQQLHEAGIEGREDLRKAISAGRLRRMKGFGKTMEDKILARLAGQTGEHRLLRAEVVDQAEHLRDVLAGLGGVRSVDIAGSYRRGKETVGDLDILAVCDDPGAVMEAFTGSDDVERVASHGTKRSTVYLVGGLQVDLRIVPPESHGAAMVYFTGSKAHNIHLRRLAQDRGWKLNEYGVWDGDEQQAGRDEREVYSILDLAWIPPELREDRGEVEAAADGGLPRLVDADDIRGDLHVHTDATDGRHSLRQMVEAAQKRGLDYVAITDHSPSTQITQGLKPAALRRRLKAIDRLQDDVEIEILKGAEVDILRDGSLDYGDDLLEELDITVCSVHDRGPASGTGLTRRIIHAMSDDHAHILGHPTGRLIGRRDPMDLDMEALLEAARDHGWAMELDGQPARLDLSDRHARMAKEAGVPVAVSSDAHSVKQLEQSLHGVVQARRGWLEKKDVLNTRTVRQLRKWAA